MAAAGLWFPGGRTKDTVRPDPAREPKVPVLLVRSAILQIRALIYFNELVRCGTMRKAADKLGVAPTAISRQIENLEHDFGAPLVERQPTGVRLTAAGELLAARSAKTLRELDHVRTLIGDLKGLQAGRVSICVNGAAGSGLLAPALADFSLSYPKLRFDITLTSVDEAIKALTDGEADLALTLFTPSLHNVSVRCRLAIAHAAVVAPGHPLANREEIALADLHQYPVCLPDGSFGIRKAIDAEMMRAGLPPLDPVFTISSVAIQKEFARRGTAVLILPLITVRRECEAGDLKAIPLAGRPLKTHLDLLQSRDRPLSFAAAKLQSFLERNMRALATPTSDVGEKV
jgi:DNA-binding transcriptional LysR family regulator